jgi:hypothetical protein
MEAVESLVKSQELKAKGTFCKATVESECALPYRAVGLREKVKKRSPFCVQRSVEGNR